MNFSVVSFRSSVGELIEMLRHQVVVKHCFELGLSNARQRALDSLKLIALSCYQEDDTDAHELRISELEMSATAAFSRIEKLEQRARKLKALVDMFGECLQTTQGMVIDMCLKERSANRGAMYGSSDGAEATLDGCSKNEQ